MDLLEAERRYAEPKLQVGAGSISIGEFDGQRRRLAEGCYPARDIRSRGEAARREYTQPH